jgi:hypothetical protein
MSVTNTLLTFLAIPLVATAMVAYATTTTDMDPPGFRSPGRRQKSVRSQKSVPSCITNQPTNQPDYYPQPTNCMKFYNFPMHNNLPSRIRQWIHELVPVCSVIAISDQAAKNLFHRQKSLKPLQPLG